MILCREYCAEEPWGLGSRLNSAITELVAGKSDPTSELQLPHLWNKRTGQSHLPGPFPAFMFNDPEREERTLLKVYLVSSGESFQDILALKGFSSSPHTACFMSLRAVRPVWREELLSKSRAQQVTVTSYVMCTFYCDVLWFIRYVWMTFTLKRHALWGVPFIVHTWVSRPTMQHNARYERPLWIVWPKDLLEWWWVNL